MSDSFYDLNGEPVKKDSEPQTNDQTPQNPYVPNPQDTNPQGQNPYSQNPYAQGQNPYGQNTQGQNPYGNGQNPYEYGQNNYGQSPYNYNYHHMQTPQPTGPNNLVILSFVFSLLAPLTCCCSSYGIFISIVLCIASIVLAFVSKQKKPFHGLAIASLIISFVYLALFLFMIISVIIVFSIPEYQQMFEDMFFEMYGDMYGDFELELFRFFK